MELFLCRASDAKSRRCSLGGITVPAALSLPFTWVSGGPTHMTKQSGSSVSEREREREREWEREKSILASTTVEHAPIWRPGRVGRSLAPRPGALAGWRWGWGYELRAKAFLCVFPQVQSSPAAVRPHTLTATSTLPSRPAPTRPSSSAPACSTTRA